MGGVGLSNRLLFCDAVEVEDGAGLGCGEAGGGHVFSWLNGREALTLLTAGAGAGAFAGGGGGPGGAAGGGGNEMWEVTLGARLTPRGAAELMLFPDLGLKLEAGWLGVNVVFGVAAGPLPTGAPDAGAEGALVPPCLNVVRARSSSAQGAGGGRSCSSGGGRKDREGLGAVGGGAGDFGVGTDDSWVDTWTTNMQIQEQDISYNNDMIYYAVVPSPSHPPQIVIHYCRYILYIFVPLGWKVFVFPFLTTYQLESPAVGQS